MPPRERASPSRHHQPQNQGRAANQHEPEGDEGRSGAAGTFPVTHRDTLGQSLEVLLAPGAVVWTVADGDKN